MHGGQRLGGADAVPERGSPRGIRREGALPDAAESERVRACRDVRRGGPCGGASPSRLPGAAGSTGDGTAAPRPAGARSSCAAAHHDAARPMPDGRGDPAPTGARTRVSARARTRGTAAAAWDPSRDRRGEAVHAAPDATGDAHGDRPRARIRGGPRFAGWQPRASVRPTPGERPSASRLGDRHSATTPCAGRRPADDHRHASAPRLAGERRARPGARRRRAADERPAGAGGDRLDASPGEDPGTAPRQACSTTSRAAASPPRRRA